MKRYILGDDIRGEAVTVTKSCEHHCVNWLPWHLVTSTNFFLHLCYMGLHFQDTGSLRVLSQSKLVL